MKILRREMKFLGLDSSGLSEKLGVSKAAIDKWFSGDNFPKAVYVKKMIELGIAKEAAINPSKEVEI